MAYTINKNEGSMFAARDGDEHAFDIKVNVEGKEYRWKAWLNTSKTGNPWYRLTPSDGRKTERRDREEARY